MVSVAEVEAFRAGNDEIGRLIRRDVRRLWSGLRSARADTIRDALLEIAPRLTAQYGAVAATMAAEYFEEVTGVAPRMVGPVDADAPRSSVRYGVSPLYSASPNATLAFDRIASSLTRHSLQQGRSTIHESTARTPGLSYARAPEPGACAWCLMLASRGAVYATAQEATFVSQARGAGQRREGERWHDDCRCQPTPAPTGDDAALPYDRAGLYRRYKNVWEQFDDDRLVTAKMREQYGFA